MKEIDVLKLREKLESCKKIKLDEVNMADIDKLEDIKISKRKSSKERTLDFLFNAKNPYILKIGSRIVRMEFANTGKKAEECITNVIKNIYK